MKLSNKAFTLIELVIVIVLIGLTTAIISLNLSVSNSLSTKDQVKVSFEEIVDHSILTGAVLACYVTTEDIKVFDLTDRLNPELVHFVGLKQAWRKLAVKGLYIVFDNGKEQEIQSINKSFPIYFFPTGESSGAILKINSKQFTHQLTIANNGELEYEVF